jgi:phage protein D
VGLGVAIASGGQSDALLGRAVRVEVSERLGETTTYRLRYDVDIAKGDLPLLSNGLLEPGSELSVVAPAKGGAQCLVKGPVHSHQIHLQHGGPGSWLEVRGSDTGVALDREHKSFLWDKATDSDAASKILGDAGYGTDVEPTTSKHVEDGHTLIQRDSDLRFLRRLARRNGYLLWITADSGGTETAHFRRPPVGEAPSVRLDINHRKRSVAAIDIGFDVERPTSVEAAQVDLTTKQDLAGAVPKSPLAPLGKSALAAIATGTRSVAVSAPADDAGDLQARAEGALVEADFFVRATLRTSTRAVGAIVRAHTVAELSGAGKLHSGAYLVSGVRHVVDASAHVMEVELLRNAWGS